MLISFVSSVLSAACYQLILALYTLYILKMVINYCVGVNADVDLKGKVCEDHCILQHSNR